ncbi:MAG: undecaprenyldiphospho-muramoylpentapeptide beta-N-acetylglucosaminyltransferase [bacterium]
MARPEIRIVIAGGGTGGHLYPGISLAEEIQKRGQSEIMFVGTSYGIENQVLPDLPYTFKKVWIRGLQRKLTLANILFPLRLFVSVIQSGYFFSKFKPQAVIGTGGYVSGPALLAALILRIPTIIQEQNSYPGLVNRTLGKWVDQIHVTYEDSLNYFKKYKKAFISGNPIRGELGNRNKISALQTFRLQKNKITLFIFGGSQGAHAINSVVLNCLEKALAIGELQILWATGNRDYERINRTCQNYEHRVSVHPFIYDMPSAYAVADFVVCRAGASTLSEITACGLPSILIPYPYATAGHQDFNAKSLEKAGAAWTVYEENLSESLLIEKITTLVSDSQQRESMARAARKLGKPEAAATIVDAIETLIERGQ